MKKFSGQPIWHRGVNASVVTPTVFGFLILTAFLGGFGIWACYMPIEGAVMAPGTFVASGQNKSVQHFEGGIVSLIHVTEGQPVSKGQALASLDKTPALSKLRRLQLRKIRLLIMQARLDAEINERETFELPAMLQGQAADPEVAAMFARQQNEMLSRRTKDAAEEEMVQKEISGLHETIVGYKTQVDAIRRSMNLFADELKTKDQLIELRLARKPEVLALQRSHASLSGNLANYVGKIGDGTQKIARAEQQILEQRASGTQASVEELRETENDLDDVMEQMRSAQDVLDRTEIRAPVDGIVVKIHHHTQGGVIAPGAVLLEILPTTSNLVIEARVAPNDIVHVSHGQDALVRLTTKNRGLAPMIKASVIYLSADAIVEQFSNERAQRPRDSFVVRVSLDDADVRAKCAGLSPTPGMPAEVFIKTGERTFLDYLLQPVADSFVGPRHDLPKPTDQG